jgi:orotidine-5'-phosphate decarboxylase
MLKVKNRLVVALDVASVHDARVVIDALRDVVGMFKIGSQLFTAAGPQFVREVVSGGSQVFLDLKFHDIPNTVAAAAVAATRLRVSIINVHAAGGSEMMHRAADAVREAASRDQVQRPAVIAVTVLTSASDATLAEVGLTTGVLDQVRLLAQLAATSGLDGVVASPREIGLVREAVADRNFLVVTPGVRPADSDADDQKRIMTPAEAVRDGADLLVIGRPILRASDPVKAATDVVAEIEAATAAAKRIGGTDPH